MEASLVVPLHTICNRQSACFVLLRVASTLFLAALLLHSPVTASQAKKGADKGDYVGQQLPRLTVEKWINGPTLSPSRLRGVPWVLVMMSVDAPVFEGVAPLLESIHKESEEGGPVVIVFSKEESQTIENVLRKRGSKPNFSIANDRRLETYLTLDPPSLPFLYLVGADSKVIAQGNINGDIQRQLRELKGAPPKGSEKSPASQPVGPQTLAADFEERVVKALGRDKPQSLIALLREVYDGEAKPTHPRLEKLWEQLDGALKADAERVATLVTRHRYGEARDKVEKISATFQGFAPAAKSVAELQESLAQTQGQEWLGQARDAKTKGNKAEARILLKKILEHYANTSVGTAAKKMLEDLGGDTSPP